MAECTGLENRQGKPSWVQIPRPPPEFIVLYFVGLLIDSKFNTNIAFGLYSCMFMELEYGVVSV